MSETRDNGNRDGAEAPPDQVQALVRGLAVIRAFDGAHANLTLSDVARRTNLSRAVVRRFLATLVSVGYVQVDGRFFSLRPRVLELGQAYLSSLSVPEVAQPHLDTLVSQVGESASMAVLDGGETVSVARAVAASRIMILANTVGTRFPAHAGAMGRVLLAYQTDQWLDHYLATTEFDKLTPNTVTDPHRLRQVLLEVRAQGYCFVNEELAEGLRSCAVPIRLATGRVRAAINISVHYSRLSPGSVRDKLLPPLREAQRQIEGDLRLLPE